MRSGSESAVFPAESMARRVMLRTSADAFPGRVMVETSVISSNAPSAGFMGNHEIPSEEYSTLAIFEPPLRESSMVAVITIGVLMGAGFGVAKKLVIDGAAASDEISVTATRLNIESPLGESAVNV